MNNDSFRGFIRGAFCELEMEHPEGYIILFKEAFKNNLVDINKIARIRLTKEESQHFEGKKYIILGFQDLYSKYSHNLKNLITSFQKEKNNQKCLIDNKTKTKIIAEVIIYDLVGIKDKEGKNEEEKYMTDSKFIQDNLGELWYFYDDMENDYIRPRIFKLKDSKNRLDLEFSSWIYLRYNLQVNNDIMTYIINYAMSNFENQTIHSNFFYNIETKILYVFNRKYHVFKLTGTSIPELIPNGKEVLFRESKSEEIKILPLDIVINSEYKQPFGTIFKTGNILYDSIINIANLEKKNELESREQLFLLLLYFFSIPFANLLRTKPVLLFNGNSSCGKSLVMEIMGKFLLGEKFHLRSFSKESRKDFEIALINNLIVGIDNLDKFYNWIEDIICAIATNSGISMRTLYKTTEETNVLPNVHIWINNRTKYYTREDFITRLLNFNFGDLGAKSKDDKLIINQIEENKDLLYSIFIYSLDKIVYVLNTSDKFQNYSNNQRIVGWIKLTKYINEALQLESKYFVNYDDIIQKLSLEKSYYEISNIEFLEELREVGLKYSNKEFKSSELLDKLIDENSSLDISPKRLGIILTSHKRALNDILKLEIIEDRHLNQNLYVFRNSQISTENLQTSRNITEIGIAEEKPYTLCAKEKNEKNIYVESIHESLPQFRNSPNMTNFKENLENFVRSHHKNKKFITPQSFIKIYPDYSLEYTIECFNELVIKGFFSKIREQKYYFS